MTVVVSKNFESKSCPYFGAQLGRRTGSSSRLAVIRDLRLQYEEAFGEYPRIDSGSHYFDGPHSRVASASDPHRSLSPPVSSAVDAPAVLCSVLGVARNYWSFRSLVVVAHGST